MYSLKYFYFKKFKWNYSILSIEKVTKRAKMQLSKTLYSLKWCPIFWASNFVSLPWKLGNPCCHNQHLFRIRDLYKEKCSERRRKSHGTTKTRQIADGTHTYIELNLISELNSIFRIIFFFFVYYISIFVMPLFCGLKKG